MAVSYHRTAQDAERGDCFLPQPRRFDPCQGYAKLRIACVSSSCTSKTV
jgi:hypothetical protein